MLCIERKPKARVRPCMSAPPRAVPLQVYPPDQLNSLMAECDFVVMALPGTPATQHFVGKEAIKSMKPTGVLINIGRGSTLDTMAARQGEASTGYNILKLWHRSDTLFWASARRSAYEQISSQLHVHKSIFKENLSMDVCSFGG